MARLSFQHCNKVSQACDFLTELFDFRGVSVSVRDGGDSGCGYLHNFVGHVNKSVKVHGGINGGENHPDVGREVLQEQFMKEGVGNP